MVLSKLAVCLINLNSACISLLSSRSTSSIIITKCFWDFTISSLSCFFLELTFSFKSGSLSINVVTPFFIIVPAPGAKILTNPESPKDTIGAYFFNPFTKSWLIFLPSIELKKSNSKDSWSLNNHGLKQEIIIFSCWFNCSEMRLRVDVLPSPHFPYIPIVKQVCFDWDLLIIVCTTASTIRLRPNTSSFAVVIGESSEMLNDKLGFIVAYTYVC